MASTHKLRDDDGAFWKIFDETKEELKTHPYLNDRRLLRPKVIKRFAALYKIPESAINSKVNGAIYSNVSLVMTLLFPRGEKARQNLRRELERGNRVFLCAVDIARGKIRSREEYVRPGSTVIKKTAIELSALLHSVCELASQHGYSDQEIVAALELAREQLECS